MLKQISITIFLFFLGMQCFGQQLKAPWIKVKTLLIREDTVELTKLVKSGEADYPTLAYFAILTCKTKVFISAINHLSFKQPAKQDDFEDPFVFLPTFVLWTGNDQFAHILYDKKWRLPDDAVIETAMCMRKSFLEIAAELNKDMPGLQSMVCSPPDANFLIITKWLVSIGYKVDYAQVQELMLTTGSLQEKIWMYLLSLVKNGENGITKNTMLLLAISSQDHNYVKTLLEEGDIDASFVQKDSCMLEYAIHRNDASIVTMLLQANANTNWISSKLTHSVISEAALSGNYSLFRLFEPYIKDINLKHDHGNNVLHILAAWSSGSGAGQTCFSGIIGHDYVDGHQKIVDELKNLGLNFNQVNDCGDTPLDVLATQGKKEWKGVAASIFSNTYLENSLNKFAVPYIYLATTDTTIVKIITSRLDNLEELIGNLTINPYLNNLPVKDSLVQRLVFYAHRIPDEHYWGKELSEFTLAGNANMVRWILSDIPQKKGLILKTNNLDSLRSLIVNEPDDKGNTPVLNLLKASLIPRNSTFLQMTKAILSASPDLMLKNKSKENAYVLLSREPELEKMVYRYFQIGILKNQILDINPSDKIVHDDYTGEDLRKDIADYRNSKQWIKKQSSCFECLLQGPDYHNDHQDNIINVTGVGTRNLGAWPKNGCDDFKADDFIDRSQFRYTYYFFGDTSYRSIRQTYGEDEFQYLEDSYEFRLQSKSALTDLKIKCDGKYTIPGAKFDNINLSELPGVVIEAESQPISITQGNNNFILNANQKITRDRSMGDITISYVTGDDGNSPGFRIYGNRQFSGYNDLIVPSGNAEEERFRCYVEIARLTAFLPDSSQSNLDRKTALVSKHLLSEYSMQRQYLPVCIADYQKAVSALESLAEVKKKFNDFYRNFTTLTKQNVPVLESELNVLLGSGSVTPEEKGRFSEYLKKLKSALTSAQLASLYLQIFNDQLNLHIEDNITDYQRYTLELAQYVDTGMLKDKDKKQLLLTKPFEFKSKYSGAINLLIHHNN